MDKEVLIPLRSGEFELEGALAVPESCHGIVVFAHGSGSSRRSPRNRFVAQTLQQQNLGTLLFDLLTAQEDTYYEKRFDIPLLTERLVDAAEWVKARENLPLGLFGASTGAAAALRAAAELGPAVRAVVSRGGRPDLATEALGRVAAETLLIVGEHDDYVLELNRRAYDAMTCAKQLAVVPGATHLFSEPGALEEVARLAAAWFLRCLRSRNG